MTAVYAMFQICLKIFGQIYMKLPKIDVIVVVLFYFFCKFCVYEPVYENEMIKQDFSNVTLIYDYLYLI